MNLLYKEYHKQYRITHKREIAIKDAIRKKIWKQNPVNRLKKQKYDKQWRIKYHDKYIIKARVAAKLRRLNKLKEPLFRCKEGIRGLIRASIKAAGYHKTSKTIDILGCTPLKFKKHIEDQFKEGMTWLNHGKWHLDHIIPMALAKTEEEVIRLNHYTNFQPLWAKDNLKKSNKTSILASTFLDNKKPSQISL